LNIVVASGKGGVGKSMIASSLAILFSKEKSLVAVDCDVDTQNMSIWLGIEDMKKGEKISVSETAEIDETKCIKCGKCISVCRYDAIKEFEGVMKVNHFLCEGCGTCEIVCPASAIKTIPVDNAFEIEGKAKQGFEILGAQLFPGRTGSGKIVSMLREKARQKNKEITILDSPAGIGCPVTASITNTQFSVLVTEPTPSGLSDLKRVLLVVEHFKVPFGIIINKWDINEEFSKKIVDFAGKNLLGKISYDKKIIESLINMKPIIESNGKTTGEIKKIFFKIKERIGGEINE